MKLTPWYPAHIKPVRPGVYQVYFDGEVMFQHWNCKFWGVLSTTPENAALDAVLMSVSSPRPKWRGLAKEPK